MQPSDRAQVLTALAHQILKTAQGAALPDMACNVAVVVYTKGRDGYSVGLASTASAEDVHGMILALADNLGTVEEMPVPKVGKA